jgi:hypothetical protein
VNAAHGALRIVERQHQRAAQQIGKHMLAVDRNRLVDELQRALAVALELGVHRGDAPRLGPRAVDREQVNGERAQRATVPRSLMIEPYVSMPST